MGVIQGVGAIAQGLGAISGSIASIVNGNNQQTVQLSQGIQNETISLTNATATQAATMDSANDILAQAVAARAQNSNGGNLSLTGASGAGLNIPMMPLLLIAAALVVVVIILIKK